MKKIAALLAAASMMALTVPAFAQQTQAEKDQCLLASKNCAAQVDSIQQRIKKLDQAIKEGKKVYTPEELKKLQDKLKETQDTLDTLEGLKGGAGN